MNKSHWTKTFSGAPNENILQNQLNIALSNVFYPPLFGLPTRTIFKNVVGYDAHHAKNEKPHVLPQQLWRRGWLGVCKSADPLWFIHHIRPSTFALNPKSGQKYFNYAQSPNSGPKKLMNPHSAAIAGSGNPLKSRFESQIWAKIFSNFADTLLKTESQIAGSLACSQGPKKKKIRHTASHFSLFVLRHLKTRFSRTAVIRRELSAIETTHSLDAKLLTQSAKWLRKLATFF